MGDIGNMAAAQPNSQESWAGLWLPFDLPGLESDCPEGAASPTSTDLRIADVGCSEAGKGPAEKHGEKLAGRRET